jgi:hypothetical protein
METGKGAFVLPLPRTQSHRPGAFEPLGTLTNPAPTGYVREIVPNPSKRITQVWKMLAGYLGLYPACTLDFWSWTRAAQNSDGASCKP